MGKNIVICSDGTGNTGGKGRGTNVFKLYEAVDLHGHLDDTSLSKQIAIYDDGVGTEKLKPVRLLTGAVGIGMSRNVKRLYAELARLYESDDRLFFFGFSRGAFTVRTLVGLIDSCGIIDRNHPECRKSDAELRQKVNEAYDIYREKYSAKLSRMISYLRGKIVLVFGKKSKGLTAGDFMREYAVEYERDFPIRFVGVWDTVAAVGLPWDGLTNFINRYIHRFSFPDSELSDLVDTACHALSIDDQRCTFHPLMWDQKTSKDQERIEQVWFAGVHSNVGGGYPKHGMSLVALDWMMEKAEAAQLRFLSSPRAEYHDRQNVHDKLYDSRAGVLAFYRFGPRNIGEGSREHGIETPKIHESTFSRVAQGTHAYAPGNIPTKHEVVCRERRPAEREHALERLKESYQTHLGQTDSSSPLDRVKMRVKTRRQLHMYLAVSLAALLLALFVVGKVNILGAGELGWLPRALIGSGLVSALLVGFWSFGRLLGGKVERQFSELWHSVIQETESCHELL